jgi:regulatory protein
MDLYQAALAYTARYATSKENLRRVLWRKLRRHARRAGEEEPDATAAEAEIASVIKRLEDIGAVDDRSYGETLVRTLKARGTSARAVRAKLAAKGVPPAIAEDLLRSPAPESEERAAAARYAERRRLGPYRKGGLSPDQRNKDLAAMCRAGFSFSIALEIIGGATGPA